MAKVYLDVETRSATGINRGVYNYAADEHFAVILVQWAVDDGPVYLWEPQAEPMPSRIARLLKDPSQHRWVIHNSTFERVTMASEGIIDLKSEWIIDTMIQALSHALPAALGDLCEVFGLEKEGKAKQKDGRELIKLFTMPRTKDGEVYFNDKKSHPAEWQRFREYGRMDVVSMREVHKKMPTWNYPDGVEYDIWLQDQKTNDRGLPMDMELAHAAIETAVLERGVINKQTAKITGGVIASATKGKALIEHIKEAFGIELPNLQRATVEYLLDDPDTPPKLRELANLRIAASRNAASKYHPVIRNATSKGRLHNTIQFMGASRTGRDAGRVFQPQNLMRPTLWRGLKGHALDTAIAYDITVVKALCADLLSDDVMELLGNLTRSLIVAPKGKKFSIADLSNIEGRGLVWLSGEQWKVDYFRAYDRGEIKFDNYQVAYANAMNVPVESVDGYMRAIGKVMELGLGYGGGVAAFLTFAAVYNLDLTELADAVWATGNRMELGEALGKYEWAEENGYHGGLEPHEYSACEYLKTKWRLAHPKTVEFWRNLEDAFKAAINYERKVYSVEGTGGKLKMLRQGGWLRIQLPSGRCLVYANPRIEEDGSITFMGRDPYTGRWTRLPTYGGRLSENVTSGAARDVMFHNLPKIEAAGYPIILRVHDELVAEVPDTDEYNHEELAKMMSTPHDWCLDWPLAAAGFDTHRYRGGD